MIRLVPVLLVMLSTCAGGIGLPQDRLAESPAVESIPVNKIGCPKLPEAEGSVIIVEPSRSRQLPKIVANASPGTTILLADGTYTMTGSESDRRMIFAKPRVTLRSVSGNRDKVIIDGEYITNEIVFIAADEVTIADITLRESGRPPNPYHRG